MSHTSDSWWLSTIALIVGVGGAALASTGVWHARAHSRRSEALSHATVCDIDDLQSTVSHSSQPHYVAVRGVSHTPAPLVTQYTSEPVHCVQLHTDETRIFARLPPVIRAAKVIHTVQHAPTKHCGKDFFLIPSPLSPVSSQARLLVPYNLPVDSTELSSLIHCVSAVTRDEQWPAESLIRELLTERGSALMARKFVERVIETGQTMTAVGFVREFDGELYLTPTPHAAIAHTLQSQLMAPNNPHVTIDGKHSASLHVTNTGTSGDYHNPQHHPIILSAKSYEQLCQEEAARVDKYQRWVKLGLTVAALSATYFVARSVYRAYSRWMELQRLLMFSEMRREERERRARNRKRTRSIPRKRINEWHDDEKSLGGSVSDDTDPLDGGYDSPDPLSVSDRLCVICLSYEIDTLLLECGHFLTCHECAARLSSCPVCRTKILRRVKVYG